MRGVVVPRSARLRSAAFLRSVATAASGDISIVWLPVISNTAETRPLAEEERGLMVLGSRRSIIRACQASPIGLRARLVGPLKGLRADVELIESQACGLSSHERDWRAG